MLWFLWMFLLCLQMFLFIWSSQGIEKRWHYICKFTTLPLEEFKDGIKLSMGSTFFQFDNSFYVPVARKIVFPLQLRVA